MNKEKYMKFTSINALSVKAFSTLFGIAACSILLTAPPAAPQTKATAKTMATQPEQETFATPQQAADAMVLAVRNDDVDALLKIFGPDGKDFVDTKRRRAGQEFARRVCRLSEAENARQLKSS